MPARTRNDGESQGHGSTTSVQSKHKAVCKVFGELQAEHLKRVTRAAAYRAQKRQEREQQKDSWISAVRRLKRELCAYEKEARRKWPTLKSLLTPERIAVARAEYLEKLAREQDSANDLGGETQDKAALTLRKATIRLPVEEEPVFDAETGEELSAVTPPSLFDEDLLRALQPSQPVTERSAGSSKQESSRFTGNKMRSKRVVGSAGLAALPSPPPDSRAGPTTQDAEGSSGGGRTVIWALPRASSSSDESDDDEEDAEFLEHRWLVTLQAMEVHNPQLHKQIQDVRRCREVHKQELLELLEAEERREQERQAEERVAIGALHRQRLVLRHERERRQRRLGIERVRYDYEFLLGKKMIACDLIR